MKALYTYRHLPFTNFYIIIWITFFLINLLDISHIIDESYIQALYNIANVLCKYICVVVIANYTEQEHILRESMDLQSVNFISGIIKYITKFEKENRKLSSFCQNLTVIYKKFFTDKIPTSDSNLKLDLLKKILPMNLDTNYIYNSAGINYGYEFITGKNKELSFICVMFMDIVNYTELAKRYSGDTIFKLLDQIYHHFDNLIKKYSHLQKIETIGDAYMVVGDIYRTEMNHKTVIKDIILLGLEFIKEIKTIKTPDKIPLCIRIGITMGPVNIGILGNEIPRLCVVGNTVNMASRLQSTADADTIQISRHIHEQLQDIDIDLHLQSVKKENVFLKNIGSVNTFVITPPP